jgi:quercetin dioxygenase-like cupin family protein
MEESHEELTLETLGSGIHDPRDWRRFSSEQATVTRMYGGDADCSSVVVWCLQPGQENSTHVHYESAHFIVVLEGSGLCLRGEGQPADPLKAGQVLIVPRGVVHGIRNDGHEPLSYAAYSTIGWKRETVGEQAPSSLGSAHHE